MALFNFGRKQAAQPAIPHIRSIQVLGGGCKNCRDLLAAAKEAVKRLDLHLEVEYITDMEAIMASGVLRTPALVVDGKVAASGRVLKAAEIEKLLRG